ncbi:MAG: FAD-dependent oxidoreductase, partial [Clostridia bacterium]|nr:FAD-dependent oxidoreductase [Clostridia bacterium]
MLNKKHLDCDLCVIGGGIAGMLAAISAAREGINVVLMHERPVLGGNASSEIRMWICGARGENNRETGILEEIALENLYRNPTKNYPIWDTVLFDFVKREKNITLLLNCTCMDAQTESGNFADGRDVKIKSVTGYQMTTQSFIEVSAKYFCDSSGDSILAPLTGANFRLGREAASEFDEITTTDVEDKMTMGMSCLVYGRETTKDVKYTPPTWAGKLTDKDFENREPDLYDEMENFWYLELGGDRDTIGDTEILRDELVSIAAG